MKSRILTALLVVSLLINAGGITFLCLFVSAQGHIKSLKQSNKLLAEQFELVKRAVLTSSSETQEGDFARRSFISHYDGEQDYYAIAPPLLKGPNRAVTLIVYLHGQGATCLEPFIVHYGNSLASTWVARNNSTVVLSCNFRLASWGNQAATADITQNVREICQQYPVTKIVMVGTSMGGCIAPTYAALAPPDIKDKIVGVVSVEGSGDLTSLYKTTSNKGVQIAMIEAMGGTSEQVPAAYAAKSLLPNIDHIPTRLKFAVVSGMRDVIVPPALQKEMVQKLEEKHVQTKLIELDIGHGIPPAEVYMQALDFVL